MIITNASSKILEKEQNAIGSIAFSGNHKAYSPLNSIHPITPYWLEWRPMVLIHSSSCSLDLHCLGYNSFGRFSDHLIKMNNKQDIQSKLNPLSVNDEYIRRLIEPVGRCYNGFHRQNHENDLDVLERQSLTKFTKKIVC